MNKTIVIGGGPSGIMAAGTAAKNNHNVLLFEKNEKLGKKLYITGKGRCNVTNGCAVEEFLKNIPGNPYFMYSSLYSMDSFALIEFFENLGVEMKIERGNRVFPVSDKSSDVIKALEKYLNTTGVDVHLYSEISEILTENEKVKGVKTSLGKFYAADSVIVATGGVSYPATGSTGDGYKFARALGHSVTKLYPSLVSIKAKELWIGELQGLSLKNVSVFCKIDDKVIYKDFGEMLFTQNGVTGPIILSLSRELTKFYSKKPILYIDLKPALTEKELDNRILRDFDKYKNKDFINSLDDLLPQKIIPIIVKLSNISPSKKVNEITKEERKNIVTLVKGLKINLVESGGFNEAVVTCGGICTDQIDPGSMMSKIIEGLYFVGEVLDVDGYTGGFNLQIAFSTGYLAGLSI